MFVDFVEGEDGGVELAGEVEDFRDEGEGTALAVALLLYDLPADVVELLAGERILDLPHPSEIGRVEDHVHRMEADHLEPRGGEVLAVRLYRKPQIVVEETAILEEDGNLQQLGLQPVRGDSRGKGRDGVGTAADVVVVAEQVRRVGNVKSAVRPRAGGLGRVRQAGLDDLAEGVAVRGTGQEVGMDATPQPSRLKRPLNHVRRVRDEHGQLQLLRRQQAEKRLQHRLRRPVYIGREAEYRPFVPLMRSRRPFQKFHHFVHIQKKSRKNTIFLYFRGLI